MRTLGLLVVFVVVALAGVASARMVRRPPTIEESCSSGPTWDHVMKCLARHGTPTVLHAGDRVRVVRVARFADREDPQFAAFLYLAAGKAWRIAGAYRTPGAYELLAVQPVEVEHQAGYRLDVAGSSQIPVTLEDTSEVAGTLTRKLAVYCGGAGTLCIEAVVACDVLVRGKAYRTFRGKIELVHRQLRITGDRSSAGECAPPLEQTLPVTSIDFDQ